MEILRDFNINDAAALVNQSLEQTLLGNQATDA